MLSTNKELLPVENKHFNSAVDSHEQEILLPKISGQLKMHDREETNKKLKAKKAVFNTKGRSLSLASFRLLPSTGKKKLQQKFADKTDEKMTKSFKENKDKKYLQENKAQGELDKLNLKYLINVSDVNNFHQKN